MNKYVGGALIFVSGVAVGEVLLFKKLVQSDSVRKVIVNDIASAVERVLYGETKRHRNTERVTYRSYADRKKDRSIVYGEIVYETSDGAEDVLKSLRTILKEYGFVTVQDMRDLANVPSHSYWGATMGWTNLDDAHVEQTDNGYVLDLPKPYPVK